MIINILGHFTGKRLSCLHIIPNTGIIKFFQGKYEMCRYLLCFVNMLCIIIYQKRRKPFLAYTRYYDGDTEL